MLAGTFVSFLTISYQPVQAETSAVDLKRIAINSSWGLLT